MGVNDLRREETTNLCELGAEWFDSAVELAEWSDVLLTSLPGPVEIEAVMLDPNRGALAAMSKGNAYFDMSTNSPALAKRLAEACQERDVQMLDCPVSMRPPNMTIMVGGDQATFDRYKEVLDAMGKNVYYVGESGQGCVAKLITQYMGYTNFVAAAEALLIAANAGIDLKVLSEIVPVSAGASRAFDFFPRLVFPRDFPGQGSLNIVAKDLHLACELAREVGCLSRIGDIADDVFQRAQSQGLGHLGFGAIVQVLEQTTDSDVRLELGQ